MRGAVALVLLLPSAAGAYSFVSRLGCPPGGGAAWPERLLPSVWTLHQDGYPGDRGLPFDDVQSALARGMAAWDEPCCSSFRGSYGGTTDQTALSFSAPPNVVSFRTSNWSELGLGVSTIAVTWPQWTSTCELVGGDMLFNAVNFTFRTDGSATDLQAIATHEFGHWLGLGHSAAAGATMLATYVGGIAQRSLEQDDEDGLCALYPGDCQECEADADCAAGEACNARGACRPLPCDSDAMCPEGTACVKRECRPGCRDDGECPEGAQCHNASCRSDCSICQACLVDADCGTYGYRCVDMGDGLRCTEPCESDADCDGDALCSALGPGKVCAAPSPSQTSLCPVAYGCELIAGCPGLWSECAGGCAKGADTCVAWDGADRCSCTCVSDTDCGEAGACVIEEGGQAGSCVPRKVLDPCWNVSCAASEVCNGGRCVDREPCARIVCDPDEECRVREDGSAICWSPCGPCPVDQRCDWDSERCEEFNLCDEITCDPGLVCDREAQECRDPCASVTCNEGERCDGGVCGPVDLCADVSCGAGERCEDGVCVCDCGPGETCVDGACVARPVPRPVHAEGCSAAGSVSLAGLAVALALLSRRRIT